MKRVVAAGLGVCCLFRSAVQRELHDGDLRELSLAMPRMFGTLYLIHRKDKAFSMVQSHLIDQLRVYLASS
jgi:DNA-binding transcriptional LysR family regulator